MGKREIKKQLKSLIKEVKSEKFGEYLAFSEMSKAIDELERVSDYSGIDLELDFQELKGNVLIQCIQQDEEFDCFKTDLGEVIGEIECWKEELNESKQEEIQEELLDPLVEVMEGLEDVSWIECEDDLVGLIEDSIEKIIDVI